MLPDFALYYKATATKTVWCWENWACKKNEIRIPYTLSNIIYKNTMDWRPKCKTGYHQTPRGTHRQNTLTEIRAVYFILQSIWNEPFTLSCYYLLCLSLSEFKLLEGREHTEFKLLFPRGHSTMPFPQQLRNNFSLMSEWITEIKDVLYGQHRPSLSGIESIFVVIVFKNYLFLAALDLHGCAWAFSRCGERGLLSVAEYFSLLLIAVASLVAQGLQARGFQ